MNNNIINILPDYIANQIAAGEVVQRPESVIKELVENSIDAGADSIAVVVRGAGKQLMHVVDNGCGMSKEDLALAPKRHATSKIKTQADLERIMTFGFRGEALASISSVANIEIRTKREFDEIGWRLLSSPNSEPSIEPFSMDNGTQILVKNLFYDVPARKKFLKSDLTEFRYISDTMMRFAISNPDIRFTFYDEDTKIFDVQPSHIEKRIIDILGSSLDNGLMKVDYNSDILRIWGYIGQPHLAKQNSMHQYFFLNKRNIQSKSLSHAVFSAFEHLIEKNYKPLFILFIEIDYELVDVNVHPQKHEVKFEDERLIYNAIRKAVSNTLQQYNMTPSIDVVERELYNPFEQVSIKNDNGIEEKMLVNRFTGEILSNRNDFKSSQFASSGFFDNNQHNERFNNLFDNKFTETQNSNVDKILTGFDAIFGSQDVKNIHFDNDFDKPENMYWQMHNKYIFTQTENGILVIDQHNAHERVLYEKAIKAMNKEFAYSQELLFPVIVKLSPSHLPILKELENDIKGLGFNFTYTNENNIEIIAVPGDIPNGHEELSLIEILDDYSQNLEIKATNNRDRIAASYACKSAIKTGKKLNQSEMKNLANSLFKCTVPYVCPHGRPVILEFSMFDLDKQFKRIL